MRLGLVFCVLLAGCTSGITAGSTQSELALCKNPIKGKRYSLCGHVATASIAPPSGKRQVIGAVDATPGNAGGKAYSVEGGTFHAAR